VHRKGKKGKEKQLPSLRPRRRREKGKRRRAAARRPLRNRRTERGRRRLLLTKKKKVEHSNNSHFHREKGELYSPQEKKKAPSICHLRGGAGTRLLPLKERKRDIRFRKGTSISLRKGRRKGGGGRSPLEGKTSPPHLGAYCWILR